MRAKTLTKLALLLGLSTLVVPKLAAQQLVQINGQNGCVVGNEAATPSISTGSCVNQPGDFLIVTTTAVRPASTLTITDTVGDTFVNVNPSVYPFHDTIQDGDVYVWIVPVAKGGSPNVFTSTPSSGNSALEIHVSEWSGMRYWAVDQVAIANGATGGTSFNSGTKTTTKNGELIFGYTFPLGNSTPGAGFTGLTNVNGDWDEYQVQTTAGPIAATFTSDNNGTWLATMVTFAPPPWNGILSQNRAIDWTFTGIPGGIPSSTWANCVTAACNTAFSTPTSANISAACSSAPANTVVRIPVGTFTLLSGSIACNASNVVLRGAGPRQTTIILNGNNILMGNGSGGQGSTPGGLGVTSLGTLIAGSTILTVGSTTGLSSGQIVQIDELNDTYVLPNGNAGNENATRCDSPINFFGCSTRSQAELVQVVSVNSGTQITITPGLSKTYSAALTPQIFFWSTSGVYSTDGVENMTINAGGTAFAVALIFCNECWVKNVAVTGTGRSGIYDLYGYRDEIRDSYISASNSSGAPTEYGIETDRSAYVKIENNIAFGVTTPFIIESAHGIAECYNYTLRTPTDNIFPAIDTHRSHVDATLYEGNVTADINWDNVWGSSSHSTAYRNYVIGNEPNATNYRTTLYVQAQQRYENVIGNVLGTPSLQLFYECSPSNPHSGDLYNYDIGWNDGCQAGGSTDSLSESTLARWGNWDSVTYGSSGNIHGTRWCTGNGVGSAGSDAFNSACTASETASADPIFPGLTSPNVTLPASFYLAAQPSWWATPYGTPPFPPIGPDITGGNITNTAGHANQIPAQLCYNNTPKDANGFLTAFDANVCYTGTTLPAPPTNLTATPLGE